MKVVSGYPKVSVIIPVYNGESLIKGCLNHLLAQNYPREKLEIIVVDNNSTDNTGRIARDYKVMVLNCPVKGPAAARNTGIAAASGDYLLFTDVDCLPDKNWVLSHVLTHLYFQMADPSIKVVGGGIAGKNKNLWAVCDDICAWSFFHPHLPPRLITKHHPTANLSISRDLGRDIGGFDELLQTGEDFAFCAKIREYGYRIFFAPYAKVTHINRATLREIMKHPLNWSTYSYQLLSRRHQILFQNGLIRWGTFWATFFKNTVLAVWYSLRVGRMVVLLLLPVIVVNRILFSYGLLNSFYLYRKKNKLSSDISKPIGRQPELS